MSGAFAIRFTHPAAAGATRRRGTPPRLPMVRGHVRARGRKAVLEDFPYG